jgi:hypothetical protein
MKLKLGWRVDLTKIPVASIQASMPKGSSIAPGEKSPLVVTVTTSDGKVLKTEGEGQGKVMWRDLNVQATVVTVNNKGVLKLPADPRLSDGKIGHVIVTVPSHPGIQSELDITPRYDRSYTAKFSGNSGMSGTNGIDGTSGTSGMMGSLDPNNPSPGGDGSDGGNGTDGQDGGPGGDGPPVKVRVTLKSGTHPLLQVGVTAVGRERFYLIDPQGGSLSVSSEGGRGGSGGKGGRGGRAAPGVSEAQMVATAATAGTVEMVRMERQAVAGLSPSFMMRVPERT